MQTKKNNKDKQLNVKEYWGKEPIEDISLTRSQICLNGYWYFRPYSQVKTASSADWGIIQVPGRWKKPTSWLEKDMPGLVSYGDGDIWTSYDGDFDKGLYEREIEIPEEWDSRSTFLKQERDVVEAEVFIDDKYCGKFDYINEEVDISNAVKAGGDYNLRVLVTGSGVTGDILLCSRPEGVYINDLSIETSVRKKELKVNLNIKGLDKSKLNENINIKVRILDAEGREEKVFNSLEKISESILQGQLCKVWEWEDPQLWDLGQPYLYTLLLEIEGTDINDVYRQRFGFREFWIEGREFYLNGSKINLRPIKGSSSGNVKIINRTIDSYLEKGFNMIEVWPQKENNSVWPFWYQSADEKGILITGPLGNIWKYLNDWDEPGTKEKYEEVVKKELQRVRNHPSIIMWGTNGNVFGSGLGMNPVSLGKKKDAWFDCFYWRKRRAPVGEEGINIIKKNDPTRPVFTHHGGGVGDVYTLNMYLNMIPLQEREEWLSYWSKYGSMPLMIVEFGTPLYVTLFRGRTDYGEAIETEPLMTEFCSIYFGNDAYKLEEDYYRDEIEEKFLEGQKYSSWHGEEKITKNQLFQKLQYLFIKNTWRSWRTMGMSGGMVPWSYGDIAVENRKSDQVIEMKPFKPCMRGYYQAEVSGEEYYFMDKTVNYLLPAGKALKQNNNSTLIWIAGEENNFLEKGHNYYCGEKIEKQVVVINDTRQQQEYSINWKVSISETKLDGGKYSGDIEPGKKLMVPLKCQLPLSIESDSYNGNDSEILNGQISIEGCIGSNEHEDQLEINIFNKSEALKSCHKRICCYDPVGKTRKMMSRLGYQVEKWQGESDCQLVIIGNEVLSKEYSLPGNLERYIKDGGKVVIFNQHPDWFREQLGLRVSRHLSRRVFKVSDDHPITRGLDDSILRDWGGESDIVEPYPEYTPGKTKLGKWWFPYYGYHWGNKGSVSSAAIEKPHKSSWRPILECEFDLAYSPLMELEYGSGRLILSTLDLARRSQTEPAADLMMNRIIKYISTTSNNKKAVVSFIGKNIDADKLDRLGLIYKRINNISQESDLIIVGKNADYKPAEIKSFIENGGKVFFMHRSNGYDGFDIKVDSHESFRLQEYSVPDWKECEGLSISDLRSKVNYQTDVITEGCQIGVGGLLGRLNTGKGTAIFSMFDPDTLNADSKTYLRITRWRQTRTICQLLSNMGASFKADSLFFNPGRKEELSLAGKWDASIIKTDKEVNRMQKELLKKKEELFEDNYDTKDGNADNNGWPEQIILPRPWDDLEDKWGDINTEVYLKRVVNIPENWQKKDILLSLGKLDNTEEIYVNGHNLNQVNDKYDWPHNHPRTYTIPAHFVREGNNEIVIRVYNRDRQFDVMSGGGFVGLPDEMYIKPLKDIYDVGFYHNDYREDYILGDDPYRYFNF